MEVPPRGACRRTQTAPPVACARNDGQSIPANGRARQISGGAATPTVPVALWRTGVRLGAGWTEEPAA